MIKHQSTRGKPTHLHPGIKKKLSQGLGTRIGYSRHLYLKKKEDCMTCELCDKELTIRYITIECPNSLIAPDKFSETYQ